MRDCLPCIRSCLKGGIRTRLLVAPNSNGLYSSLHLGLQPTRPECGCLLWDILEQPAWRAITCDYSVDISFSPFTFTIVGGGGSEMVPITARVAPRSDHLEFLYSTETYPVGTLKPSDVCDPSVIQQFSSPLKAKSTDMARSCP